MLSTSQREDQMERCASGEAVIVGGLVIGPMVVIKTLVSPLVLSLPLFTSSAPEPACCLLLEMHLGVPGVPAAPARCTARVL